MSVPGVIPAKKGVEMFLSRGRTDTGKQKGRKGKGDVLGKEDGMHTSWGSRSSSQRGQENGDGTD